MNRNKITGQGYHVMAKPNGPVCNLGCRYCFYLEKRELYPHKKNFKMEDDILEAFIKDYTESQDIPEIQFVWQGGEPLLAGIPFYKKVIEYQRKYMGTKKVINSMQTNGVLLDAEWCAFLKKHRFLVGISLDGPEHIHDDFRQDLSGKPSYAKVKRALDLLDEYEIPYNVLVCVTRESCKYPGEIYSHLKELGVKHIQFTPIVERTPDAEAGKLGLTHSSPDALSGPGVAVTDYSVIPSEYGDFLITVFNEWVRNDVGTVFVMNFEWALESWLGLPSTICLFARDCGRALAIEHNGDVYSCDHYVFPDYLLGNIQKESLQEMLSSTIQNEFSRKKSGALSTACRDCEVRFACNGECPRLRFVPAAEGSSEYKNYLCEAYKKYFHYIHRYMKVMAQLVKQGEPVSLVMEAIERPIIITRE